MKVKDFIKTEKEFYQCIFMLATTVFVLNNFLFFPAFYVKLNESHKFFNGFFIITNNKLIFKTLAHEVFFKFSLLLKFSILLSVFLPIFSFMVLKSKKYLVYAFLKMFCSLNFLLLFLCFSNLRKNIINCGFSSNNVLIKILWPYYLTVFFEFVLGFMALLRQGKEKLAKYIFYLCNIVAFFLVTLIISYFLLCAMPVIIKIGFFNFAFNPNWHPENSQFGIFNFILSSFFATLGAIILAAPLGILTATFLSEVCNKKIVRFIKPFVEILAGIPSVIYGFFGMTVIVPAIRKIFDDSQNFAKRAVVGDSLLAVILVLAIMILPTIISTAFVSLKTVPKSFKEASLNLGATKTQTIFNVVLKVASPGIFSGLSLAVAKAIGETMAVMMVAGNVSNSPKILSPVKLLTSGIAIDIAYSSGLFRKALFGMSLILFVLIIIVNFLFHQILKKVLIHHRN